MILLSRAEGAIFASLRRTVLTKKSAALARRTKTTMEMAAFTYGDVDIFRDSIRCVINKIP
jgi:hypothetical protein